MPHIGNFSGKCKLIVADIDNTFVGKAKALLPRNVQAIRDAAKAGIPFAIATGRYWKGIKDYISELGIDTPQICDNGATLYSPKDHKALVSHVFGEKVVTAFYELYKAEGYSPVICTWDDYHAIDVDDVTKELLRIHSEYIVKEPPEKLRSIFSECIKITLYVHEDPEVERRLWKVSRMIEDKVSAMGYAFKGVLTEPNIYTVNAPGICKLTGVSDLCGVLGCTLEDVLAVGDGDNDVEMLSGCGLGFAVANGTAAAKDAASGVVAGCEDCGFAEAVYSVL